MSACILFHYSIEYPADRKSIFQFGSKETSALSFASLAAQSCGFAKDCGADKGFVGAGQQLFGQPTTDDNEEDYDPEKEVDKFQFKPIVSLPAVVDMQTGEEGEMVVYSHRAKLYRFDAELKQWKERGVGEIKILVNAETNRSRIVMRRDQIHKLCANHYITREIELKENAGSDRSWVWSVNADFAEGMAKPELLAVRFKHRENAVMFQEKFVQCQEKLRDSSEEKLSKMNESVLDVKVSESEKAEKESDEEVMVTYEKKPSAEEEERARRYALPPIFYTGGEREKLGSGLVGKSSPTTSNTADR